MKVTSSFVHALLAIVAWLHLGSCVSLDPAATLAELYERAPEAQQAVEESAGYAVFSNASVHPGLLTFARGKGEATHGVTGVKTPLRMFRVGAGPGLAIKRFNMVFIFEDDETYNRFIEGGWGFGALAEASFKFGSFGASAVAEIPFSDKIDAYGWTHTGLALEFILATARVWETD